MHRDKFLNQNFKSMLKLFFVKLPAFFVSTSNIGKLLNFRVLLFALLLGISFPSFAQGPWAQKKGEGYLQFQSILPAYRYKSLLNGRFLNDRQGVNRKTFNSDFSFYLEYGLGKKLDVIAFLPFKYISTGDLTDEQHFDNLLPEGDLFGLSNPRLAIRYGLIEKNVNVAVSLQTSWNMISKDLEKGLATGFDANSFGAMVHIGRSKEKHYGFLAIGYHKYTNDFSDVLEINLEHGWKIGQKWNLALALIARHSLDNGSYKNENLEQTGFYPNNQEWAAISGKAAYELANGFGVNLALPLIPIKFQYVGFNGTIGLGIYKKFQ